MAWQEIAPEQGANSADSPNGANRHLARNWGWLLLRGMLAILSGAVILAWPGLALLWLILLFAAYLIADGIVGIVAAIRAAQHHERWGWLVVEGVLGIVAGLVAFFIPTAAILSFVALACAWAVISGVALLVASFRLHRSHGRWLMALAGLLSVVWGLLLLLAPAAAALVLTMWLGAYSLVFGMLMTMLALRLRRRHDPAAPRGPAGIGGAART